MERWASFQVYPLVQPEWPRCARADSQSGAQEWVAPTQSGRNPCETRCIRLSECRAMAGLSLSRFYSQSESVRGAGQIENVEAGDPDRTGSRNTYMAACSRGVSHNRASEIELEMRVTCLTRYCSKIGCEGGSMTRDAILKGARRETAFTVLRLSLRAL